MALGDIMRLLVVTVFCVFGTRGLTTRKLPATGTTMPATQELTTTQSSGATGSVTTNTTTNTTTNRPDGLLNKYNITATASASASSTASASAAFLTNPPPLRQPVPEALSADPAQQSRHGQAQQSIPSQPRSSLHSGPTPNVILQQNNNLHGGLSASSVSNTLAIKVSQQTTSGPVAVPAQTETTVPNSSASVPGAVYPPTTRPELTPGPASVTNTYAEAPHRVSSTGSVGQYSVSGHPGVTATKSFTSTAHTQSSATLQQQPTPTQLSPAKAFEAAAAAAPPTLSSSATGSSPAVTIIPYPCDGYNCPTDKPHCVLVRQQCKALRCPAVPTCAAVAPVTIHCLVGHPVYDDMFSALTCGPRGDYSCPIHSDCDETSGFAACCWTGSHGVIAATSKMEPTSYLLSAPKPRAQKSGDCPRSFQTGSCINACTNDRSCAGPQKCCSNGCGTACVDPVAPAPEAAGSCPVLGIGESCPSSTLCNSDSQCSYGSQCCFLSRTCRVCVNTVMGGTHASGKGSSNGSSSSKSTPQGSVVPQQQSGSGVGDLGRIRPGDLIVDLLNHGANGSHAVISGMTNGGIVQLGRHHIGRVDGSVGTNGIGNGPSNPVTANVDTMAVSNVVAAALTGPSSAANSASSSNANNVGGTGTSGGVVNDTSGSTISAKSVSSQTVDRTLPVSLDSLTNAQGSSSMNINDVNSGNSANVIGDITLGGAISGSVVSVSGASGPTVSPTVDAGPSMKSSTLSDVGVSSGGAGATGVIGDIVSGGGGSAILGGADRHLTLATNSGGVSSNTVGTVINASGNNGNGILNGQLVNAAGNSGAPGTGISTPGITYLDTGLSTGTVTDQGITGNGQVVGIGTGDFGNVVSGQVGATSQSVMLPQGVPDPQGGLSQIVLDSPVGVTDVLGGSVVVGANAVGGVNGVNAISHAGIDGIHTGILGTAVDQLGGIGNNPSGMQTDGIGATALAGNGALGGTIDATGAILVPGDAAVVNAGSNSNMLQNVNRDNLGASGSLLSNGITPSGSGSSRSLQTARRGSLGHPSQPRFQVEIETTHFAPHLQSGRRVSNVGRASAGRKHTSTSVKIGGGSNHFSTSVNIGHGGNSRQEVNINHNVAGRNGNHAGNPRLQTSINIGSSPDGHPEISKTVSMNAPRSQNYRQLGPVNRQTSPLLGASSLRGAATASSGTSNRMNGITDQLRPGSRPSYLAPGSGNSLRSSASRSATITKSDPFVRPRTSSLSRSTIAGSTASRAIAAGNVVVNGGVTGIRGVSRNPSRNTARSSPGMSNMLLNRGAPRSVSGGNIGIGSASGSNTLGLSERPYSSATAGQYPVRSGSRLAPSAGNPGATHVDVLGTSQSRSRARGALNGLTGLSLIPPSDVLLGSDFAQFSPVTDPQGNTALGMSPTSRINNVGDYVPATSNVPPSSPTRSRGAEISGVPKPSAFPLPTSYDATATKPGFCLKPCGFSLCMNECSNDRQCPGSQKCCSSGCGRVCSPPFPYIPTIKPGVCPSSPSSAVCTRGHSCSHDGECPASSKCCCVGGGCRVCVLQGRSLPKMAPAPVLAPQTLPQFGMIGKGYVWR